MVKAYLKYEQVQAFGVVTSSTAEVLPVPNSEGAPLFASAAVDTVVIWNLRKGESVARLGNVSTRKAGAISALAVSKGGETIAAGYSDGSIRLWNFNATGMGMTEAFDESEPEPLMSFNGHRSGVSSLAFDDCRTGEQSSKRVSGMRPATLLSGSNDGDVIMWNIVEGTGAFRLPAHNDVVTAVLLLKRKNFSYVVSASKDGLLKVHDTTTQHCMQTIVGHRSEIWAMAFDLAQSLLLTGSVDAEIRGFLLVGEDELQNRKTDGQSTSLKSYETETVFKPVGSVRRYTAAERVTSICFTEQGGRTFVAVAGADKTGEIFSVRKAKEAENHRKKRKKRKMESVTKEVRDTGADEGWTAATIEEKIEERKTAVAEPELQLSDFLTSARQLRMKKKLRSILFLLEGTFIPVEGVGGVDLQLLVQSRENTLEIHRVNVISKEKSKKRKRAGDAEATGDNPEGSSNEVKKLLTLDAPGHRRDVRSISLAPDGNTLISTSDGSVKLWNIAARKCIRTMKCNGYGLSTELVGADARIGVVGFKDGTLQAYDLGSGVVVAEVEEAHKGSVWSLCLDDHIYEATTVISAGADKRVCFWSVHSILAAKAGKLELSRTLEVADEVLCMKVAHGRDRPVLLVSMMDATVRAYFLDTLEPYLTFYGHRLPVMCFDISSDGLLLATGSADKTVKLWGMDFGDCRRSLRAHNESVLSITFQPDTHYLFSGSRDGSLKYWDGDKFELITEVEGQRGEVWSVTTSNDGELLASASHDRMIRVWRRTDEPLFLEEERDKRMDEMFESALVDEDLKAAQKERKDDGFMKDTSKGEATDAGKRSLETVKGGERLLEALQLCAEERGRLSEGTGESPNPLMLGLSAEAYMLRAMESIKVADFEEALHILPLDEAVQVLQYCNDLLSEDNKRTRLSVEMLARGALYLIRLHHKQIASGAASRKLMTELRERLSARMRELRERMGFCGAGLEFWNNELADRDDAPFRDASARAYNLLRGR